MKSLVFLSCAFMFANALNQALVDELIEKIQEFGIECVEQENPPQSDLEALMNKQPPSSHEGKCTIFCTMKKFNIMTDASSVGPGYAPWLEKAQADDPEFYSKLRSLYKACASSVKLHGDDGCENAFEFAVCSKTEGVKIIENVKPLAWWRSIKHLNSRAMELVQQLHTAIASAANIERLFSSYGLVHSKLRNKLGNVRAAKLVTIFKELNSN